MKFHKVDLEYQPWDDFKDEFKKKNSLEYLGGGAYATAYSSKKERNVAYKICSLSPDCIDGYLVFLKKIVARNKHNPCLPKIYGVNVYKSYEVSQSDDYPYDLEPTAPYDIHYNAIVKMERLIKYTHLPQDMREAIMLKQYGIVSDGTDFLGEDEWIDKVHEGLMRIPNRTNYVYNLPMNNLTKIFHKVMKQVDMDKERVIGGDMHDENIMWRKTGRKHELVVIDPIS